jgi:hypothetical protein
VTIVRSDQPKAIVYLTNAAPLLITKTQTTTMEEAWAEWAEWEDRVTIVRSDQPKAIV